MQSDPHCEKSFYTSITMCRQQPTRNRHDCFNLALLIGCIFVDCFDIVVSPILRDNLL